MLCMHAGRPWLGACTPERSLRNWLASIESRIQFTIMAPPYLCIYQPRPFASINALTRHLFTRAGWRCSSFNDASISYSYVVSYFCFFLLWHRISTTALQQNCIGEIQNTRCNLPFHVHFLLSNPVKYTWSYQIHKCNLMKQPFTNSSRVISIIHIDKWNLQGFC